MSDKIEQEIQANGLSAPRVTLAEINADILHEVYFTAGEAAVLLHPYFALHEPLPSSAKPLDMLTFCVLVLRNGFTVTGESYCVSPENFDEEKGRKIARENAIDKVWPLMGYALKQKLHEQG